MVKILAIGGSLRRGSFNKKLAKLAAAGAMKAGAQVTIVDLANYPLPLYNQDVEDESGLPENAKKLKKLFIDHDGFLFSSPEYNSSISGVFKNVIDWVSRPEDADPAPLIAFKGKIASIMSASPSYLGGLRGLVTLRSILSNINVLVLPEQLTIPHANKAFNESGQLIDPAKLGKAMQMGERLANFMKNTCAKGTSP